MNNFENHQTGVKPPIHRTMSQPVQVVPIFNLYVYVLYVTPHHESVFQVWVLDLRHFIP